MPDSISRVRPRSDGGIVQVRRRGTAAHGWLLLVCVVAGASVMHLVRPIGFVGGSTYLLITGGAGVLAWVGVDHQGRERRFPMACIAVALTSSAIGDCIFFLKTLIDGPPPGVTIADPLWIVAYVTLAVGLFVGGYGMHRVDVDRLVDVGSFTIVTLIVVSQFAGVRLVLADSTAPVVDRVVSTAYPILDALLVGVVVQAILSGHVRGRSGKCVGCGIAAWLFSDFGWLLITDSTLIVRWLDVGWMIGAVSIAVSAWPVPATDRGGDAGFGVSEQTSARVFITLLPLLVPGGIGVWEFASGRHSNPVPLFGATIALVALAFIRSARLVIARNRQEQALERSTRFYAALAENSSDAVIVVDATGLILNDAPNLLSILGRTDAATIGMDAFGLLRPFDRESARVVFDRWWSTNGVVDDGEVRATAASGAQRWFGVRAANMADDPDVGGMVINLRDITDRKLAEDELSHNAFHDSLTGLANRALFHDRLEHALQRTARVGSGVAVVYLDLDGFKAINDGSGHEAGDRVLREVATRLAGAVRTADTVARLGGDEFAILLEESSRAIDEAQAVADRILQSLTTPFAVDLQQVALSASIGIAIGDGASTASSMLRDADIAMYRAKTTGRDKWEIYEPAMGDAARDLLELDNDLRRALDDHQLRVVYQPVIDLVSDGVTGFEALCRWDHPTRGLIQPKDFIPIAEANGTIIAIGEWVLDQACDTAARWHQLYPATELTMSVNLSARQIATPSIIDHVVNALSRSGLPATSLILEITESVLVEDAPTAIVRLRELRALHVRLAIDDFGTGYSSLSYLRQFPIDILKIDKSFTDTITDRDHFPAIVLGLLELAKILQIKTVAEGIEHGVQRDSLRDHRCDFGQGYLFDKPLDINQADEFLEHAMRRAPSGEVVALAKPASGEGSPARDALNR
ncbi:MAG: EAL domain-containing protein [Ilumatobacteraceae bacterium]